MFDELIGQVKKLFSSKTNGGKLVYKLTDRLHYYKQALILTSIILLLGYSQFRPHFHCRNGSKNLDAKFLNTHCWINGTETLESSRNQLPSYRKPHIGIQFELDDQDQPVYHNYSQSLWALLILMGICSFVAQRQWLNLFRENALRALLKLPGYEDLALVKKVDEKRPYLALLGLTDSELTDGNKSPANDSKVTDTSATSDFLRISLGEENEHDRALDHYPNQLIYLLLSNRPTLGLGLRRRLICYATSSFLLTLMQFILPWFFIGPHYKLYGWYYLLDWVQFALDQFNWQGSVRGRRPSDHSPSVYYQMSSRIFPTMAFCRHQQWGPSGGMDSITVTCIVPINEICAKVFVIIWWLVAINVAIEICALTSILLSTLSLNVTRCVFCLRFWPNCKQEVNTIASFKHQLAIMTGRSRPVNKFARQEVAGQQALLDTSQSKKQEAKNGLDYTDGSRSSLSSKKWYLWCSRDICLVVTNLCQRLCGLASKEQDSLPPREDPDVYHLLYLLHLRLLGSKPKTEEAINMTARALDRYKASLIRDMNSI